MKKLLITATLLLLLSFKPLFAGVAKGVDVREVQTILTELCFNVGPIDGVWGKKTEKAAKDFFSKYSKFFKGYTSGDFTQTNLRTLKVFKDGLDHSATSGAGKFKRCSVKDESSKPALPVREVKSKNKVSVSDGNFTKRFVSKQSDNSPINQVFNKAFRLSETAYKKSIDESLPARMLERLAATGPQTKNFIFKGYSGPEIASARNVIKNNKNKIKEYRQKHKSTPFLKPFSEDDTDGTEKYSIVFVPDTIEVKAGTTFDGKDKIFVWIGEGDCSQKEGMPDMFAVYEGATIKNLFMIYAPDGIHFMGSNASADRIVNLDVCEDAMTGKTYYDPAIKNISVTNSVFYNCADKGLQFSKIRSGLKVIGNKFIHCFQPIRINKFIETYEARDNRIVGARDYWRLISYKKRW